MRHFNIINEITIKHSNREYLPLFRDKVCKEFLYPYNILENLTRIIININ